MGTLNKAISMIAKGVGDIFTTPQRTQHGNLKPRIATLKTQAAVATFLAAVHAQILAYSIQNNTTPLRTAINAFTFTGVLLDVVGATLSLLASTSFQTNLSHMDAFLATTSQYDEDDLKEVNGFLWESISFLEWAFWMDVLGQTRGTKIESKGGDVYGYELKPGVLRQQVRDACDRILMFNIVGDAAGTATLFGILCFLISVVCLATATQPPAVWIPAVIAALCVVILPLANGILAIGKFRCPNIFSL